LGIGYLFLDNGEENILAKLSNLRSTVTHYTVE